MNENLRIPPYSLEAEQSVIGSCLIDKEASRKATSLLSSSDFYMEEHALIFKAIKDLVGEGVPPDIVSVANKLKDNLKSVGGITYLSRLAEAVPNTANVEYYGQIVKELSIKRKLIHIGGKISELGFQPDNVSELLHKSKELLDQINENPKIRSTGERALEILQAIERRPPDISTGVEKLNPYVKMYKGDLILIEAQRKNGKTTFAMNLLLRCLKRNYKVMLATYEIPADTRFIPLLARAYAEKVPFSKDEEMKQVTDFLTEYGDRFYTLPENTYLEDFETLILDFIKENKIDFVFIDYDQLVKTHRHFKTEERRVSTISRTFKRLALEGNCVVVMLSQINAQGEGRWSAEKENDASVVLRLEKDPVLNEIKVWIPYNRYNRALPEDNAVRLEINWGKRLLEEK